MMNVFLLTIFLWLAAAYCFVLAFRKNRSRRPSPLALKLLVYVGGACAILGLFNAFVAFNPEPSITR